MLDLLRLKLKHLDIVAEPESMYADDKRADIAIYYKNMKLPIEIKRDDQSLIKYISGILEVLNSEEAPKENPSCGICNFRKKITI